MRSWRYLAAVDSAMLASVLKTESCAPSQHLCGCRPDENTDQNFADCKPAMNEVSYI